MFVVVQATMELLFFASVGDPERCRVICETWGINVADRSCCDYDKRTPLHLAAAEGCYAVVQWLLYDAHAKPNAIDRFGRTPLEDAVRCQFFPGSHAMPPGLHSELSLHGCQFTHILAHVH